MNWTNNCRRNINRSSSNSTHPIKSRQFKIFWSWPKSNWTKWRKNAVLISTRPIFQVYPEKDEGNPNLYFQFSQFIRRYNEVGPPTSSHLWEKVWDSNLVERERETIAGVYRPRIRIVPNVDLREFHYPAQVSIVRRISATSSSPVVQLANSIDVDFVRRWSLRWRSFVTTVGVQSRGVEIVDRHHLRFECEKILRIRDQSGKWTLGCMLKNLYHRLQLFLSENEQKTRLTITAEQLNFIDHGYFETYSLAWLEHALKVTGRKTDLLFAKFGSPF